jgi:hypothetical protein
VNRDFIRMTFKPPNHFEFRATWFCPAQFAVNVAIETPTGGSFRPTNKALLRYQKCDVATPNLSRECIGRTKIPEGENLVTVRKRELIVFGRAYVC